MIQFLDLKTINAQYRNELVQAAIDVIDSGWYIQGTQVETFEREFADYCGVKHCIGVANGLDALILTLRAWKELGKLKEGDEVIVPSFTIISCLSAIIRAGATPVFCEVDNKSWNMTLNNVLEKKTNRTRAVLMVHLYGLAAEAEQIENFCNSAIKKQLSWTK